MKIPLVLHGSILFVAACAVALAIGASGSPDTLFVVRVITGTLLAVGWDRLTHGNFFWQERQNDPT